MMLKVQEPESKKFLRDKKVFNDEEELGFYWNNELVFSSCLNIYQPSTNITTVSAENGSPRIFDTNTVRYS
jgi:hypothetical protein